MSLRNYNLLIIAPRFPDEKNKLIQGIFIKQQVDMIHEYFNKIIVIVPIFYRKFLNKAYYKYYNYSYKNVLVKYIDCLHIPPPWLKGGVIINCHKKILNFLKNTKIDLIHSHFTWPSGYIANKIKEQFNLPYILTIHENQKWFLKEIKQHYKPFIEAWKNADMILRVNPKDYILLKKINKNTEYFPNTYSNSFFMVDKKIAKKRLNISNQKIIFSFGIHVWRKGFQDLILAINYLAKDNFLKKNDITLFLAGTGPLTNKLKEMTDNLNLSNYIRFLGELDSEKLNLWINASDIFVFPSHSESFGLALLEALSCGIPAIATRNGASEYILTEEKMGYLVNPKSPVEMAKKIKIAITKTWDRKYIHNKISSNYSPTIITKKLLKRYERILSKHHQINSG